MDDETYVTYRWRIGFKDSDDADGADQGTFNDPGTALMYGIAFREHYAQYMPSIAKTPIEIQKITTETVSIHD